MRQEGKNGSFKQMTPDRLRELYRDQTDLEIAQDHGVHEITVRRYRKKWGVATKSPRQRRDFDREGPCLDDLTPIRLAELYASMSDRQIAKLYGVKKPAIARRRRQWGIASVGKAERSRSKHELTEEQKALVIGTVLGDGFLFRRGALKVAHSHNQLVYLQRKQALLQPLSKPLYYEEKRVQETGNLCYGFGLRTEPHAWLKTLRGVFYPNGVKVLPTSLLEVLSPISLAFWYFDDGHLSDGLPSFALGNIGNLAAREVVSVVGSRFGLETYLKPQSTASCQLMGIRARSCDLFFKLIRDHATPDMSYKLPSKHKPRNITHLLPVHTLTGEVLPKELVAASKAWGTLDKGARKALAASWADFWAQNGFPYPQPRPEEIQTLLGLQEHQVLRKNGGFKLHGVGQATCHAMMPHIWEARSFKSRFSPMEVFQDPVQLRKAIAFRLKMGRVPTGAEVRTGCRSVHLSGVYNFRPAVAKVLVDRFCRPGGVVFDPCGGYGGRLMGAVLSVAQPTYVACEPNPKTAARLGDFAAWLDGYVQGVEGRTTINPVPAEDFDPGVDAVDMVLTSPPYWKREDYGDSPLLSGNRYTTYEAWLAGFWRPVLERAAKALKPSGWMVLNVDDFRIGNVHHPLIEDTCRICADLGLGLPERFRYEMPRFGDSENHEAVLAFCKRGAPAEPLLVPEPVVLSRCRGCGSAHPQHLLHQGHCAPCLAPKKNQLQCTECDASFEAIRANAQFCSEACGARFRRRRKRAEAPKGSSRVFTCHRCREPWECSEVGGSPKWCPTCREDRDKERRRKLCGYRHCGEAFVDTSLKNSMRYCSPDHRDREKQFRSGLAKDEGFFRRDTEPKQQRERTCRLCKEAFTLQADEKGNNRCHACREAARLKECQTCGTAYRDPSIRNTRKFCFTCSPP